MSEETPVEESVKTPVNRVVAKWLRWLHIYLSLVSFAIVLFFSLTGITLNHPTWFGGDEETLRETKGTLKMEWLTAEGIEPTDTNSVARLEIVEHLRAKEKIRGAIDSFSIDEYQCTVAFRGPAYTADIFIDRETGEYELAESQLGVIALMNDLHKGRDTGAPWLLIIDLSAILLTILSLTGLSLIFWLKRHRGPGLIVTVIGTLLVFAGYFLLVTR